MISIQSAKKEFNQILKENGVADYENNVTQIFLHILNCSRVDLLIKDSISVEEYSQAKKLVLKRADRYPLQYLIGEVEFCGNRIMVNPNVLIPRNETEQLCDMISKTADNKSVLDLCCGSGCIGLGIKANSSADVTLVDISSKALTVAKNNAKLNGLDIKVIKSNLFDKVKGKFDIIVSNPPYIKTKDLLDLQPEVKNEPMLALDGEEDGYAFYRRIIDAAPKYLNQNGEIYFEYGVGQSKTIEKLLKKNFECIKILKDYYNKNRFIYAKLKDIVC